MNRPSVTSIAVGTAGGIASAVVVGVLLSAFDYHVVTTATERWTLLPGAFVLGFATVAVSAHTGLVSPGGGFLALLTTVVYIELTTAPPQAVVERGDDVIVDGSFHALSYADTWYVWLALLLVAGVAEFAIRRGYELGDDRLRNLPVLPLSRTDVWLVVAGCSVAVGLATMTLLVRGGLWDTVPGYGIGFVAAAVATAVRLRRCSPTGSSPRSFCTAGSLRPPCIRKRLRRPTADSTSPFSAFRRSDSRSSPDSN